MSELLDATGFLAEQRLRDYDRADSGDRHRCSQVVGPHRQEDTMAVVARFYVAEITNYAYSADNTKVVLRPSTKGEANREWAAATPSGEITMSIGNPSATKWFRERLGQDVAIRFDDVTPDWPT